MNQKKDVKLRPRPDSGATKIIGFRLPLPIATAIKVEAARRQLPLNRLLIEMWQLYRESARVG